MGNGLRMLAKAHGGIVINGERWIWDYAADTAVKESDLKARVKAGREQRKAASAKAKSQKLEMGF